MFYGEHFYNEDALELQKLNSVPLPYSSINPFLLRQPIAPNIAASQTHFKLTSKVIAEKIQPLRELPVDYLLVEGLGGWMVPINDQETMADVARALDISIIIVVGLRIGCLNHALLTLESLKKSDFNIAGWIANSIDPHMLAKQDNVRTLQTWINSSFLGYIPYAPHKLDDSFLKLESLLE
jgi:dethiobiotin synthetase